MKLLFAMLVPVAVISCTSNENSRTASTVTSANKDLVRRVYSEMVNKQNYALIDTFFAANVFDHNTAGGQQQDLAGFKEAATQFLRAFSQIEVNVEAMVAEGDIVSTREIWKVTKGTEDKTLTGETMHWFRIQNGKITDEWSKGWEWLEL